jgi:hypothetical protein
MAEVIENLITRLSFDADQKTLQAFELAIGRISKGLTGVVLAATAAAASIATYAKSTATANADLGRFAERTNLNLSAFQELSYVAEQNGASIDSMRSALQGFMVTASEASRGLGGGVEAFGILGVAVTDSNGKLKDTIDLFLETADAISGLNTQAQKLEFAQKLGFGPEFLLTLEKGSAGIAQASAEARRLGFILSEEDVNAAIEFDKAWKSLTKALGDKKLLTGVIQVLTPIIKSFTEWFLLNKKLIQQGLTRFLEITIRVLRGVFNVGLRVVNVINSLVKAIGGWKVAITAASAAVLAFNASALLIPTLWLAAGTAIFLILEDIVKYAQDGDSVLGDLIKKYPILDKLAQGQKRGLTKAREDLKAIYYWILDISRLITEKLSSLEIPWQTNFIEPLKNAFGFIKSSVAGELERQRGFGAYASAVQQGMLGPVANTTNMTNTTNRPTVNMYINGNDTASMEKRIYEILTTQYSYARTNLSSQVDY